MSNHHIIIELEKSAGKIRSEMRLHPENLELSVRLKEINQTLRSLYFPPPSKPDAAERSKSPAKQGTESNRMRVASRIEDLHKRQEEEPERSRGSDRSRGRS